MLDPLDFETQHLEKQGDMENLARIYQIRRLTDLNDNLLTQLDQAHIQIKEFQEDIQDQQEVIRELREKKNVLLFLLEDFKESVHDYKEKIETLKNDKVEDLKQINQFQLQDEQKKRLQNENNKLKEELEIFQLMGQLQTLQNDNKLYLDKYEQMNKECQTAINQYTLIIQQQQDQYEKFKKSKEIELVNLKEKAHNEMDQLSSQLNQAYSYIKQLQMTIEKQGISDNQKETEQVKDISMKGQIEKIEQLKQEICEFQVEQHDLIQVIINLQKSLIEKFKKQLELKSIQITIDEENNLMQILTLAQEQLNAQFIQK